MTNPSTAGSRWEIHKVLAYIMQVEAAYDVSLKFWLDFRGNGTGNLDLCVYAWGSGSIFDLIPEGRVPYPAAVQVEEAHALGEAIYYSVNYIERLFNGVREPIGTRPSL